MTGWVGWKETGNGIGPGDNGRVLWWGAMGGFALVVCGDRGVLGGEAGDWDEGFDAVAAEVFGAVESVVGEFEERYDGVFPLGCRCGYADADRLAAVRVAGMGEVHGDHGLADALGYGQGAFDVSVGEDDGELFSAKTRSCICGALESAGDDGRDAAQALVAADVSVEIVVGLEEIDVDQKEREGVSAAHGVLPFGLEGFVEGAAVCEAG